MDVVRISNGPAIAALDMGLRDLVAAALAKDPAQRPSAQQLLDRLTGGQHAEAARTAEAITSEWSVPTGRPTRADRPRPRRIGDTDPYDDTNWEHAPVDSPLPTRLLISTDARVRGGPGYGQVGMYCDQRPARRTSDGDGPLPNGGAGLMVRLVNAGGNTIQAVYDNFELAQITARTSR